MAQQLKDSATEDYPSLVNRLRGTAWHADPPPEDEPDYNQIWKDLVGPEGVGRVAIWAGPRPPFLVAKGKAALAVAVEEVKAAEHESRGIRAELRNAAAGSEEQARLSALRDEAQERLVAAEQKKRAAEKEARPHEGLHLVPGDWREMTRRMLCAYSLRNRKVGYVQSMGYLAAVLLYMTQLTTEEEEQRSHTAQRQESAKMRDEMRLLRVQVTDKETKFREEKTAELEAAQAELNACSEEDEGYSSTLATFTIRKKKLESAISESKQRESIELEEIANAEVDDTFRIAEPDGSKMDEVNAFWVFAAFVEKLCGGVWDNKSLTQDNDEILSPMPGFFVLQDIFGRSIKRVIPGLMEKLESVGFPAPIPGYPGMLETTVWTEWCHPVFAKTLAVPQLTPLYETMFERHAEGPSVALCAYAVAIVQKADDEIRAMRDCDPSYLRSALFSAADEIEEGELAAALTIIVPQLDSDWEVGGGSYSSLYDNLYHEYVTNVQDENLAAIQSNVIKELHLAGGMLTKEDLKAALTKASALAVDLEVGLTISEFEGVVKAVLPAFRADLIGKEGKSGVQMLFDIFDNNQDGKVSMRELYSGLGLLAAGSVEKKLEMCFMLYDLDKDGNLTSAEVSDLFQMISRLVYGVDNPIAAQREAEQMCNLVDTNRDGCISLEEFKHWSGVRPAVLAFFKELGLGQVQADELPAAMASIRPTPEHITNQLQRWVPPYLIPSCSELLAKMETAETSEEREEVKKALSHEIGSSILNQAMSAATDQVKEDRAGAEGSMGGNLASTGPYSSLKDETNGLIAGESVLLPSTPCTVHAEMGSLSRRVIVTNYRLMVLPQLDTDVASPDRRNQEVSVFIPLGAVSKMHNRQESSSSGVLSIRPKYCFEYVHLDFIEQQDTDLMWNVLDSKVLGSESLIQNTFAFSHGAFASSATRGWNLYVPTTEFGRMDIPDGQLWRLSDVNDDYGLSPSLPRILCVPHGMDDARIRSAAAMNGFDTALDPKIDFQTRGRVPCLTWRRRSERTGGCVSLMRSGPLQFRGWWPYLPEECKEMVQVCFEAAAPLAALNEGKALRLVVDCGGGDVYGGTAALYEELGLEYVSLPIPVHRQTRGALYHLQKHHRDGDGFDDSKWSAYLMQLLSSADQLAQRLNQYPSGGLGALITCVNGIDYSAALSSLVQLLLDPFYRTLWGFQVLIEKEWCTMAYPWVERLGHCTDDFFRSETCSALMVLWLDAVYQLITHYPDAFEFKSSLPCTLGRHLYSCRFGNFLGGTEESRTRLGLAKNTLSFWSFVNAQRSEFLNDSTDVGTRYSPNEWLDGLAVPQHVKYWKEFHNDVNGLADIGSVEKVGGSAFSCSCVAAPV